MSEPIAITQRDDTSILEDIYHLLATYPPLANDRHAIHVSVVNGAVTITGHVMTTNTRRFFLSRLTSIEGVKSVDAEHLHDDTAIRIQLSSLIPAGVQANIRHGVVILSGEEPPANVEDIANKILALPGVEKVISGYGG